MYGVLTVDPPKPLTLEDVPFWRLSVDEYLEWVRTGRFTAEDHVELLHGWVVNKVTKNQPHVICSNLCNRVFARLIPANWFVSIEQPIATADSVPEPDVTIVRGNPRDDAERPTPPGKIGLVIEIADSTLATDRRIKLQVYAAAKIAPYWIINLNERQIEVYVEPFDRDGMSSYRAYRIYTDADAIPFVLDGAEIAQIPVAELLP
ncbi:MAG: Uma2 family endonuclease [Anaerolineae bacterium]|nr:Uma2 family endonuclease [Anaerolineae bacterium]